MSRQTWTALLVAIAISAPCSAAQDDALPTFRSQSNVVSAPTLVMKKTREIVFGLSARDFIVKENGVEHSVRLDEAPEAQPISLVVAVQRGGSAALHLDNVHKHGSASDDTLQKRRKSKSSL